MEEVNFKIQYNAKNKNNTKSAPHPSTNNNNFQGFKFQPPINPNVPVLNNFRYPANQNFKFGVPHSPQNNVRSGFNNNCRFCVPNQTYFKPDMQQPQDYKPVYISGQPQNRNNFKFGIVPQQGFRPQFNNAQGRPNFNPPNQQFKFGIPPQNQPQHNNLSQSQDTDVSMQTARPLRNNMITNNSDNDNLFYMYNNNNETHIFPDQDFQPDYVDCQNHLQFTEIYDHTPLDNNSHSENVVPVSNKPTKQEGSVNFPSSLEKRSSEVIHLNCNSTNRSPHIYIPEIDARLMIDTGSTRSFISPGKVDQYFSAHKSNEPFEVISTHASSSHDQVIYIPLLKTFKSSLKHKFYVYDVDRRYDGLIGSDLLKMLDATIDMKTQILQTRDTEIPIVYSLTCEITLDPRTETLVKVPTDLDNGGAIIDLKKIGNELLRKKINALTNEENNTSLQGNVGDTERPDSSIAISDSSETMITPSPPNSSYPVRSSSSSTLTACSLPETIHSAKDIDTDGIPILDEAVDTKPHQVLVFTWNRNQLSVKDTSRDKQKKIEIHLPVDNPDLVKQFLLEYIKPKIKYFFYFADQIHRKQFTDAVIKLFKKDTVKIYECTKRITYVEDEDEQRSVVLTYHHGKTSHHGIKENKINK